MELHLEFHPHRFITRFNAIQKELSAREVIYIEEDDGEEGGVEDEGGGDEILGDEDEKHEHEQEESVDEIREEQATGQHLLQYSKPGSS